MFFKNKVKHNMYVFLNDLAKSNDYKRSYKNILVKVDKIDLQLAISECVNNHYIDGINYSKGKLHNNFFIKHSTNVYITLNGYEFLKNYHGFLKRILWEIFLIITTAIITISINNLLTLPNYPNNQECQCNTNE